MSQKPASSRPLPPPTRVSNGVPWWLWLLIGGFGVFVGITLVKKAIPDDPKLLVQEGFDALEKGDVAAVERNIDKLKQYPEHAADLKLMEGMMYIGKSKPLLAVPLLREAANDPKVRSKAMVQLGSALTRSRQRLEAIEVFETVLKEDESADDARLNLAFLFKDMISWDIALQHLLVLKEHGSANWVPFIRCLPTSILIWESLQTLQRNTKPQLKPNRPALRIHQRQLGF
jgi:tetratricopeptide (TPR) repeat protein